MKIDLHVHTCHSRRPAIWILQKIGCPESFTDPVRCYHQLKNLGMGMVTFTDHNSIDGCLAVAHLPDTFISEEITAYFPEDRCKVHVLAYDLAESAHQVVQKKRANIYELVDYLREREIPHAIAHPFSAVHDRFTPRHFEKLLLLFNIFEINGDQAEIVNRHLRHVLDTLTPEDIADLSRKHGIPPHGAEPWRKRLICGSDDHAETRFGGSFTEAGSAADAKGFFAAVAGGTAVIHVQPATGHSFARDIYTLAYRYVKDRFAVTRYSGSDTLLRFCDAVLEPRSRRSYGLLSKIGYMLNGLRQPRASDAAASLTDFMRGQAERLIRQTPGLAGFLELPVEGDDGGEAWFEFVNRIANLTLADLADAFAERLRGGRYFDLFHLLGNAGTLYLMLSPYFAAYSFFAAERRLADRITRRLRPGYGDKAAKVACLTDTYHEDNGLAAALRRQLAGARASGRPLRVFTVRDDGNAADGVDNFKPVHSWEPPGGGIRLGFPALLPLLRHLSENEYSCLQAASPGPAGLAALLMGRLLGIPVYAVHHPGIARYLRTATEDRSLSDLGMKYMVWFFNQCDLVQTGSEHDLEALTAGGVAREKLRVCAGGVDRRLFSPERRSGEVRAFYAGPGGQARSPANDEAVLVACAGGTVAGPGTEMLLRVFGRIASDYPLARLIVPCTIDVDGDAAGRIVSAGELDESERARLYASCDLLVLPQGAEGRGDAILEAQASGLPVVTCDEGDPARRMSDGVTGCVFRPGDAQSLEAALRRMLAMRPESRREMGARARERSRRFDQAAAFERHWRQVEDLVAGRHPARRAASVLPGDADEAYREATTEMRFFFDSGPVAEWLRDTVGVS